MLARSFLLVLAALSTGAIAFSGSEAAAQSNSVCQTTHYGPTQSQTTCAYAQPQAPEPKLGPGTREDVVVRAQSAAPVVKVDANFCGAGYRLTADGCEPATR